MRSILFTAAFGAAALFLVLPVSPALGREETLLHETFEQGVLPEGWLDFRQNHPPKSRFGAVTAEYPDENASGEGNRYYAALDPTFGVTVALSRPYRVTAATRRIEVKARVRCTGSASTAGLDLSSRHYPDYPFQYSRSLASGFGVRGYQHSNAHNLLYAYHQAGQPIFAPASKAFAPLHSGRHAWNEWHLVYDHERQSLTLRLNGEEWHRMDKVDLSDVTFHTLWLMGARSGSDYDDLSVTIFEEVSSS